MDLGSKRPLNLSPPRSSRKAFDGEETGQSSRLRSPNSSLSANGTSYPPSPNVFVSSPLSTSMRSTPVKERRATEGKYKRTLILRGLLGLVIVFSWYSAWAQTGYEMSLLFEAGHPNGVEMSSILTNMTDMVQKLGEHMTTTTGNGDIGHLENSSINEYHGNVAPVGGGVSQLPIHHSTVQVRNQTNTTQQPLTILIQLAGEMGNNLGKIAYGICLQEFLREDFDTRSEIVLRHQERPKWKSAHQNLVKCFPFTRQFDFSAGNTPSFKEFLDKKPIETVPWWTTMEEANLGMNADKQRAALQYVVDLWRKHSDHSAGTTDSSTASNLNVTMRNGLRLTNPFLYATSHGSRQPCYDRFYDTIRERLKFDHNACCTQLPLPNETVFHFRNFLGEMPRMGRTFGYEELNPQDTATTLLGHLDPQVDQVAILAGKAGQTTAQSYVVELEKRNISARIVSNPLDVHDFCFLMQTQREIVGIQQSTFAGWAGLLSDTASTVRLYSINSTATRAANEDWFRTANWSHDRLKDRFVYLAIEQEI